MDQNAAPDTAQLMEQILYEVKRVVVGQDRFLERVMVAMLAQGHLLVEGVPGLAKTLTVKTLANVVQGKLPLNFTINLQVNNPHTELAALNKLDWIAFIDNKELVNGVLNQRVEIPGGQTTTLPLTVSADLIQAFKGESKDKIPTYAFGLADASGKPKRVGMKVKPTIVVAGMSFAYPGWITLSQDFKTE